MKSILGIGNALVDILATNIQEETLSKFSLPKGSMQLIDSDKSHLIWNDIQDQASYRVAGGSASNTITALARLGIKSGFIGKIGHDDFGHFFQKDLEDNGVTTHLHYTDTATGKSTVLITPDHERTMATHLGAAIEMTAADLDEAIFKQYQILHIEGYLVQNEELIEQAARLAKKNNMTISLDLASYNVVLESREFLKHLLGEYVDIVFANLAEARSFANAACDSLTALNSLADFCETVVVKLGDKGALVGVSGGALVYRGLAKTVEVIDTTGAGDFYAAGFLYGVTKERSPKRNHDLAAACAAEVIQVIGTRPNEDQWLKMNELKDVSTF